MLPVPKTNYSVSTNAAGPQNQLQGNIGEQLYTIIRDPQTLGYVKFIYKPNKSYRNNQQDATV